MAQTAPLKLDISAVGMSSGDYSVGELGTALDPYLSQIADEMAARCAGRKTVVFLPLIKTSQKFRDLLNAKGFCAAEVNGQSADRRQVLSDFEADKYNVLCNSMLHYGLKNRELAIFGSCSFGGGGVRSLRKFAEASGWELMCEPVEVTGTATPANLAKFEPLADAVAERIKAGRK